MKTALKLTFTGAASAVFLLAYTGCTAIEGSAVPPPPQLKAATPAALQINCADVAAKFNYPALRITANSQVAAGSVATSGAPNASKTAYDAPAHCLVKGVMNERVGVDGKNYAIGFEMRLPNAWNGRFYHQVNGGLDGTVQPALGALGGGPLTGALHQGFAVISSDAGHNGSQNPSFGADPIARQDYGYGAVAKLTPMAKALIGTAYGKVPDRSYVGGCSNGGRHAMVAASRYGDQYDGYLVGAPGYRLPNAALAQLWAGPLWQSLATKDATLQHPMNPNARIADLGTGFTPAERMTVATSILDKCDALDGAKDGIVQDVTACQAAFNVMRDTPNCMRLNPSVGDRRDGAGRCITAEQKLVIDKVFTGGVATGINGVEAIYSSFPYDTGIATANWAVWKFINSQTLDPAAGYIFMSPPRSVTPFKVAVADSFNAIYATTDKFTESADSMISAGVKDKPELMSALRNRGAKMLMYHGVSDAIFSEFDTRRWVNKVNTSFNGKAADFVRHFPVPGMNHCSGGMTTDQFDALKPLVQWVEQGIAPQAIPAVARGAGNMGGTNIELPKGWSANRSRPLCSYPTVARYKGAGSLEDAASFSCQK